MYTIGVDLGGTNLRVALISNEGKVIRRKSIKTEVDRGTDFIIEKMTRLIEDISSGEKITGVGIGAPGPLDSEKGIIMSPPNLPDWNNIPITSVISNKLGVPVKLENDANVAGLAEGLIGAGKGYKRVFYITVSTGVGGGFILNGRIFKGAQGCAGEIGNMIIQPGGNKHSSLNPGSLEALASGTAIGREGNVKLGVNGAKEVFHLAQLGNKIANQIINESLEALAIGMANISHTINPDIFILGGGVMEAAKEYMPTLRNKVSQFLYPQIAEGLKIELAKLGDDAGIIGAAFVGRPVMK